MKRIREQLTVLGGVLVIMQPGSFAFGDNRDGDSKGKPMLFGDHSIVCQRDDYLIVQNDKSYMVYKVYDIVQLRRLIAFPASKKPYLVQERDLLDSRPPAYQDEVFLLLIEYSDRFESKLDAEAAIKAAKLKIHSKEVYRRLSAFSKSSCYVVR